MTQLTGNDAWRWGRAQQEAFEQLKKQLAEDVVLAIPTNEGKFRVEADASEGAIGAVLSQEQEANGDPYHFCRNLSLLPSVTTRSTIRSYWPLCLRSKSGDITLWAPIKTSRFGQDHQNLQYFRKPQKVNRRQARWITELAEYHFTPPS